MGDDIKKITICVCTYNNYPLLFSCMQRLATQSLYMDKYDVLILDNSPQKFLEKSIGCKQFSDRLENFTYVNKPTDGLSGARNECIDLTSTELIHFIDDDALVDFNFVKNTLECFYRHSDLMVMGGKVHPNWSLVERPEWLCNDALSYLSMLDFGESEMWYSENPGMWLVGANICFRRSCLIKYGKFSNKLGRKGWSKSLLGAEEMQLIYKMQNSEKILYNPTSVVDHVVPVDRMNQSWFIKRVAWQAVSDVMTDTFYMENPGGWSDDKFGYDFLKENANTLFDETDDPDIFCQKLKVAKMLSFWMLNDFKTENE